MMMGTTYQIRFMIFQNIIFRHLKDFGFGKASMNDIITEEFNELSESLRKSHTNGEEVETSHLFNLSALNILWRIVIE